MTNFLRPCLDPRDVSELELGGKCLRSLALGHSAYNHQDKAGRHCDRHFDFNR
jgi:hypothetical protein